ncbi:hypothetical protein MJT46_008734 [Ovis ammon polii x Ovis aries]|nr:hypothetical protein MJT46_008734 [Ovis ammon polii x Ovis aries]
MSKTVENHPELSNRAGRGSEVWFQKKVCFWESLILQVPEKHSSERTDWPEVLLIIEEREVPLGRIPVCKGAFKTRFAYMWTIFKVFTEFVTILFLLYALVFWPRGFPMIFLKYSIEDENSNSEVSRSKVLKAKYQAQPKASKIQEADSLPFLMATPYASYTSRRTLRI